MIRRVQFDVTTHSDVGNKYILGYKDTYEAQGPPKAVHPIVRTPAAKCSYCGLHGKLGRCEGCGAPNSPVKE